MSNTFSRMICPCCGAMGRNFTTDSRTAMEGYPIRRRRKCDSCGERYSTYELPADEYSRLREKARLFAEVVAFTRGLQ